MSEKTSIVISATDQTAAAFRSIQSRLDDMGRGASRLVPQFAALTGALSVGGMTAFIKSSINTADEMGKLSQKLGIGVKDLAGLKFAAEQSGTSIEGVATGTRNLSRYMVENGDKLNQYGITATDANGALLQLADQFGRMPDGVQKTALAMQIFGKSGLDMIPLLNSGADGLRDLMQRGQELVPVSDEMARKAAEFNDKMDDLSASFKTVSYDIAETMLPALTKLIDEFRDGKKIAGGFFESLRLFGFGIDPFKGTVGNIQKIGAELAALRKEQADAGALGATSDVIGFGVFSQERFAKEIADREKQLKFLSAMQRRALEEQYGSFDDARDRMARNVPLPATIAGLLDKTGSGNAAKVKQPFDPYGDFEFEFSEMLEKNKRAGWAESERALNEQGKALESLRNKYQDLADPLRKFQEQLKEIGEMRTLGEALGGLSDADAQKAMDAVNKSMDDFINKGAKASEIGKELGMSFSSAFEDAIVGGKKFSEVLQGLGEDILRIITRKNVTEPLAAAIGGIDFSGLFGGLFANANGGVYAGAGIGAYSGRVVSQPTVFPFARGIGLMGEAGPEAIMPLKRGPDGRLGVLGGGSTVVVQVIEAPGKGGQQQSRQQGNTRILDVFVEQIKASIAGDISDGRGSIPGALSNYYGLNRAAGSY